MLKERTCNEYANGVRRAIGWTFAHMFNHYFGEGIVILIEADSTGKNIGFSTTSDWLKINHVGNFGVSKEMATEFSEHTNSCQSPQCIRANEMFKLITPLFKKGLPPAVALLSVFEAGSKSTQVLLSKENGFSKDIDTLLPIFEWFTGENKDFWIWPEKDPVCQASD
ncbi:MAG: hypothetical protein KAQ63_01465 [Candidatus Moranbacteria bacterium]|nr:hypothetical protein [Candidatus Moranbacteria bacterium]